MYTMLVEVNYPYPNSFLVPLPGNPVREFCSRMDSVNYNDDDGLIKALSTGVQLFTNYTGTTKCNDIGQTASPSLGELGWDFQVKAVFFRQNGQNTPHCVCKKHSLNIKLKIYVILGLYRYDYAHVLDR